MLAATPTGRNEFEGYKTQRVYALFAKTRAFDEPAVHPLVLGVLDRVLGHYQLSAPTGIQIGPGEQAQVLHLDQSVYPLPADFPPSSSTRCGPSTTSPRPTAPPGSCPGSHRWVDRQPAADDEVVTATMPAGSVMFYVGKALARRRRQPHRPSPPGVILEYVPSWLRPQENHILAVPRDVVATLPERLQELLGYNIYPPFLGYVDGRHPRRSIAAAIQVPQRP